MDNTSTDTKELSNPKLFIKSITFNDGTCLSPSHNSIVVFTGANNSGKSQVLKDIEHQIDKTNTGQIKPVVVSKIDHEFIAGYSDEYFNNHFYMDSRGYCYANENPNNGTSRESIIGCLKAGQLTMQLYKLFIRRINTEQRLTTANKQQRQSLTRSHPIFKLHESEQLVQVISGYFRQAFGVDLEVNSGEMSVISLHVGDAPDKNKYTIKDRDAYYNEVRKMSQLDEQGDGMHSFASLLLDTFTSDYPITLIDEPEAFLHPPQARLLGKILATHNPTDRQLFIATHSDDFLHGLLDAHSDNVDVVRINRKGNTNHISILDHAKIQELWKNPILRYSNILSGLFHEKVVICESDYDCLFYQAIMDAIYEKEKIAPDILFICCGGKQRIESIVKALKAVNVPVVAIADMDILNDETILKNTTEAFECAWEAISANSKKIIDYVKSQRHQLVNSDVKKELKTIIEEIQDNSQSLSKQISEKIKQVLNQSTAWTKIKETGKAFFKGETYKAWEELNEYVSKKGLFIVPVGEIESFYKRASGHSKQWWENLIESSVDFANDKDLHDAHEFVKTVVNF